MRVLLTSGVLLACLIAPVTGWSGDTVTIKIDNFTFTPAKLTISKGARVTWSNEDDIPHSIVLVTLGVRSKAVDTAGAFNFQFDTAGRFSYICGLHPQMHGQILVE